MKGVRAWPAKKKGRPVRRPVLSTLRWPGDPETPGGWGADVSGRNGTTGPSRQPHDGPPALGLPSGTNVAGMWFSGPLPPAARLGLRGFAVMPIMTEDDIKRGGVMSGGEIVETMRGGLEVLTFPAAPNTAQAVSFDRHELRRMLDLYGRKVAEGEWRDYALDFTRDKAVFSIFRRFSEMPLYRIEKEPRLARRQGAYSVIASTGLILKRGHDLDRVLRVLDKPRIVA